MRSVFSPRAVSISTGTVRNLPARRSRHNVRPSSPGIIRSSTIRSGAPSSSTLRISRPFAASDTRMPFFSR